MITSVITYYLVMILSVDLQSKEILTSKIASFDTIKSCQEAAKTMNKVEKLSYGFACEYVKEGVLHLE